MRVAWVHPSWRDLVIEHLAGDDDARGRYLTASSIHGTLLALSTAGGADGERRLPLLRTDRDWDIVDDRVHELTGKLEPTELIGLLATIAMTVRDLRGTDAEPEAQAISNTLLERVRRRWLAAGGPIAVAELEAWSELAALLPNRPAPPPIATTWVELVPLTAPDLSDFADLERFADWLALADALARTPHLLAQLGFPDRYRELIVAFLDDLAGQDAPQRLSSPEQARRAVHHADRLLPRLTYGRISWLTEPWALDPAAVPAVPDPWRPEPGDLIPELLDIDRVLRDL